MLTYLPQASNNHAMYLPHWIQKGYIYCVYFQYQIQGQETEIRKWLTGFWSHSPNDVEVCSKELNVSSST